MSSNRAKMSHRWPVVDAFALERGARLEIP
jgi:hypothetical protein